MADRIEGAAMAFIFGLILIGCVGAIAQSFGYRVTKEHGYAAVVGTALALTVRVLF